jgi:hypothetical protein
MDQPSEFSESGNPIYRYKPREKPFEFATGDVAHIKMVEEHIAKHVGEVGWVYHEIISDLVHLDVHVVEPRPERPFFTLVTSGMSARAMKVPEGAEDFSYAELVICLPPDWPMKQEDFKDDKNFWPIRLLKMLARLPHEYDSWLGYGHTIPNGDPAEPYAENTKLCCALLLPPVTIPSDFMTLAATPELDINFYGVVPIYKEEMELKLKKGSDGLIDRFDKYGVSEILDVKRKNTAKKFLGLF